MENSGVGDGMTKEIDWSKLWIEYGLWFVQAGEEQLDWGKQQTKIQQLVNKALK